MHPLSNYSFFAGLSEGELANLAPYVSKRSFAKGAFLYYPGNPALSVYLIESGLVRLFFCDARGREYLLNLIGPGSVVGMPLFQEDQIRMVGASAVLSSVVLTLSIDDMRDFMKRSPHFMHNIYREMDTGLRKLFSYARGLATTSLNGRVATMLLNLSSSGFCQSNRAELELPLSQAEMASWVGASRGRYNRALNHMQQLGVIRVNGQNITILNQQRLEQMAED